MVMNVALGAVATTLKNTEKSLPGGTSERERNRCFSRGCAGSHERTFRFLCLFLWMLQRTVYPQPMPEVMRLLRTGRIQVSDNVLQDMGM